VGKKERKAAEAVETSRQSPQDDRLNRKEYEAKLDELHMEMVKMQYCVIERPKPAIVGFPGTSGKAGRNWATWALPSVEGAGRRRHGCRLPGGSPKEEKERQTEGGDETQHKVTLTKGFYMGVYTVTQEEWQAVMGNNPSNFKGEKNLPVEQVSWADCQEFIKKLREKDKKPYRLPFEAEWEYACRAGTTTPFHFGETISTDLANYAGNFTYGDGKKGVDRKKTMPVGSFPANAFGLHDMHGNVCQWCQDWNGEYPQKDVVDPQGPERGGIRVLRGGSWFHTPLHCRSAYRYWDGPGFRGNNLGCRLCFCLD